MTKTIYLETLKSVLGCSILYYFLQKLLTAKTVSYFYKKLHLRYLTGFYMHLWVSKIRDDHSLLKVNSQNTRTRSEVCSKLTKKTLERCQWSMLTLNM